MISKQALAQQATLFTPRLKLVQLSEKHFDGMVVCEVPGFDFLII
jgi:hypothetical protein